MNDQLDDEPWCFVGSPIHPEETSMTRKTKTAPAKARGARTAIQGGAGYAVAEFIDAVFYDMSGTAVALLAVILTAFFSWAQTAVEDYLGKAFLREIPEPDAPVTDAGPAERGVSAVEFAVIVIGVVLICILLFGFSMNVRG